MREPLVSVLIPAYNIAPYIGACMDSVIAQTLGAWECIVADDGSTDGTDAIVTTAADSRVRLVRQANSGVSSARNLALSYAQGRYVLFLDGDDLLHPTALERLSAALENNPSYVAAFGTLRKILENGEPYPGQKPLSLNQYPSGNVLKDILRENFLANGGHILVRTDAARALGGFNTALKLSEDWEFWCRLAATGPFLFIEREPEIFYLRMRSGSASDRLAGGFNPASSDAVLCNPVIQSKFSADEWEKLKIQVIASQMWEGGRVDFTNRKFASARALMLRSLTMNPRAKRLILFGLAQLSQMLNISLVSRLRFKDHDRELARKGR